MCMGIRIADCTPVCRDVYMYMYSIIHYSSTTHIRSTVSSFKEWLGVRIHVYI